MGLTVQTVLDRVWAHSSSSPSRVIRRRHQRGGVFPEAGGPWPLLVSDRVLGRGGPCPLHPLLVCLAGIREAGPTSATAARAWSAGSVRGLAAGRSLCPAPHPLRSGSSRRVQRAAHLLSFPSLPSPGRNGRPRPPRPASLLPASFRGQRSVPCILCVHISRALWSVVDPEA